VRMRAGRAITQAKVTGTEVVTGVEAKTKARARAVKWREGSQNRNTYKNLAAATSRKERSRASTKVLGPTIVKTMMVKVVVVRVVAKANLAPQTVAVRPVIRERAVAVAVLLVMKGSTVTAAVLLVMKGSTVAVDLMMMMFLKKAKIQTLMERVAKRAPQTILLINPAKRAMEMDQKKIIQVLIYLADLAKEL